MVENHSQTMTTDSKRLLSDAYISSEQSISSLMRFAYQDHLSFKEELFKIPEEWRATALMAPDQHGETALMAEACSLSMNNLGIALDAIPKAQRADALRAKSHNGSSAIDLAAAHQDSICKVSTILQALPEEQKTLYRITMPDDLGQNMLMRVVRDKGLFKQMLTEIPKEQRLSALIAPDRRGLSAMKLAANDPETLIIALSSLPANQRLDALISQKDPNTVIPSFLACHSYTTIAPNTTDLDYVMTPMDMIIEELKEGYLEKIQGTTSDVVRSPKDFRGEAFLEALTWIPDAQRNMPVVIAHDHDNTPHSIITTDESLKTLAEHRAHEELGISLVHMWDGQTVTIHSKKIDANDPLTDLQSLGEAVDEIAACYLTEKKGSKSAGSACCSCKRPLKRENPSSSNRVSEGETNFVKRLKESGDKSQEYSL